jgi:ABC-2 type transport system permease protein
MASLWAFAAVVLRGTSRDRSSLFFMLALPVLVIVIIGATFGGEPRIAIGLVGGGDGPVAAALVTSLEGADGLRVVRFDSIDGLRRAARRLTIAAGVVVPATLDRDLAAGRRGVIAFVPSPDAGATFAARSAVDGSLAAVAIPATAARAVGAATGAPFAATFMLASDLVDPHAPNVRVTTVGPSRFTASRFSTVAPQNLVLFVFLNGMTSGWWIVRSRRVGILRRALAAPVTGGRIVAGLGIGSLAFTLLQTALIIVVGAVGFGVSWGDPAAATALAVTFAVVSCGAGLLVGAVFRSEEQVGAVTPPLGLVLGALGGCMVSRDAFPPALRSLSRAIPHAWALDGWQRLIDDGAGIGAIAPDLAVLAAFAAVAIALAGRILRAQLTGGG